jgi:hypothetical protein
LEWIGHAVRIDQERIVKKIFESQPEGSRMGRQTEIAREGSQ